MTDEELLNTALHGGEMDWQKLHETCHDRARAEDWLGCLSKTLTMTWMLRSHRRTCWRICTPV